MPPSSDDNSERTVRQSPSAELELHRDSVINSSLFGHTLAEGTKLGEFEITGLIGEGGFGIVYLAYDPSLQREVAVKEYMPSSLASRASGSVTVAAKSDRHRDTFNAGLRSFVNEARLLARFDHPALVKVYRFWEANGTAYMVMPFYKGPTLKQALLDLRLPPSEMALRNWLRPLLDALSVMHAAKCYHRDIAPDNILLTASGPLLLDFGAARRVVGDMTHALTVVLKPGYAPIEQYGEAGSMTQGAWTDLYALACVVYFAITGKTPMSSVERLMGDQMKPLTELAAGRYDERFLAVIDAALALRPEHRPQSVAEFQELLEDSARPLDPAVLDFALPVTQAPVPAPAPQPAPLHSPAPAMRTVPLPPADDPVTVPMGLPVMAAPLRSRRKMPLASGLAAFALLGAVAWYFGHQSRPAIALPAPSRGAEPAPAPSVQPSLAPATTAVNLPAAVPTPEAAPSLAAKSPVAAPEPAPRETTEPTAAAPTAIDTRAKPRSEPAPKSKPPVAGPVHPDATAVQSSNRSTDASRCSDILQKASLEALSPEESAYLKRECR
ncbi:MAG TPA: protein kinase [Rhizobacter sp.]|nr:protein kinase [Rhizobacter sp.]